MTFSKDLPIQIPHILLPDAAIDLQKWAVIACDQFTSQPEYWEEVAAIVGSAPSTFHMILPEVYLGGNDEAKRIKGSVETMQRYLSEGIFKSFAGFVYVEREIDGKIRHGLMVCIDLEAYDFIKGSQSLIRATEGTILERIPPRVRIRENAPLEIPHILVLFDDPQDNVFNAIQAKKAKLPQCYDFELMMGSEHISGWLVDDPQTITEVISALTSLADKKLFCEKYQVPEGTSPLLFAIGDGNHSLATAKTIWEKLKPQVGMDHPARFALVELENLHDPVLEFEPIFRLISNTPADLQSAMRSYYGERCKISKVKDLQTLTSQVDAQKGEDHVFGLLDQQGFYLIETPPHNSNLPVGTLQNFLDDLIASQAEVKIDYIHGMDVLEKLCTLPGNSGFYVPAISKDAFFKTVIMDGALPRKTFSMGEAKDKRFYLECRQIQ